MGTKAQQASEEVRPMQGSFARVSAEVDRMFGRQPSSVPDTPADDQMQFPFYLSKEQKAVLYVPKAMSEREFNLLKKQIENSLAVMEATAVVDDAEPASDSTE